MKKEKYEHPALEDIDFKICEALGGDITVSGLNQDGDGDVTP